MILVVAWTLVLVLPLVSGCSPRSNMPKSNLLGWWPAVHRL